MHSALIFIVERPAKNKIKSKHTIY